MMHTGRMSFAMQSCARNSRAQLDSVRRNSSRASPRPLSSKLPADSNLRPASTKSAARYARVCSVIAAFLLSDRPGQSWSAGVRPAVGLRPGQPAELLPLVEHARRGAARPRRRGRPAPADRSSRRRPGGCSATRVRGLATEFAGNWLDFRRFEEHNSVDRERFPSFNDELRQAMFEEPIRSSSTSSPAIARCSSSSTAMHTFVNRSWPGTTALPVPSRSGTGCGSLRGPGRSTGLRLSGPRRLAADGGLPDQELAGPADQPGQARLLGRPPAARRADSRRRRRSPRAAQGRGQAGRADPAATPGPAPRGQGVCGLPSSGSTRSAWPSRATGPIGERRDRDLGGRPVDTRATFPDGSEGTGLDGLRALPRRSSARRSSSRTSAASCWPTPWAQPDPFGRRDHQGDARLGSAATAYRFGSLVETIVTSPSS